MSNQRALLTLKHGVYSTKINLINVTVFTSTINVQNHVLGTHAYHILHVQCINLGPCDNENRIPRNILAYLDCCWFAVYNILILTDCNHNSINAWKICPIFFRVLLFLKFTRHIVEREKMLSLREVQRNHTDPETLQNLYLPSVVNPFDSAKKGVFVERDFWGSHAIFAEISTFGEIFEPQEKTQNGGNEILLHDVRSILTNHICV